MLQHNKCIRATCYPKHNLRPPPLPRSGNGTLIVRQHCGDLVMIRVATDAGLQCAAHQAIGQIVEIVESGDMAQLVLDDAQQVDPIDGPGVNGAKTSVARERELLVRCRRRIDEPAVSAAFVSR